MSLPEDPQPPEADLGRQMEEAGFELELGQNEHGLDAWINGIAGALGAAALVTVTLLVFLNASLRYLFNSGIIWADEIVIALIPWLTMLGMFLSVRRREIIRIEHFANRLPQGARRILNAFADLLSAASFAYLAFVSFDYFAMFGGDKTTYLKLPKGWFISSMLVGSALLALAFLADFVRTLRARSLAPIPEEKAAR
ncbi:TRAP transporter small permease [Ancylobacter sp. MQZ15Z-1]|uniref:TRAP transporter small permease protein n=1 Tax=Ancylobacter mangrovi TaxID=2972472 RepID=A0A9X2T3I6_9HYPH|nr:TRAP transporter small permease [Ancylobacter mangrovi]MCS0497167.1 TRAP transporter small permease [Ancylobacter mangrovi]